MRGTCAWVCVSRPLRASASSPCSAAGRARRQHGRLDVLLVDLPGQHLEELDDLPDLLVGERLAQLVLRHLADGLVEAGRFTVVEEGPGLLDVPERRHLEGRAIGRLVGHLHPTRITRPRIGFRRPQSLIRRAAQQRAAVTHLATGLGERLEPEALLGRQRVLVALEQRVPPRRCHELSLEGADGDRHVVVRDGLRLTGERPLERLDVLGHRLEHGNDGRLRRHGHLHRIEHRALGLGLDV
ncbi:MAG: hypothetical protein H6Q08_1885, partial [Acidobacteria bacterium]|nr:hypothetical protein [Acidobacteriota bacterium]